LIAEGDLAIIGAALDQVLYLEDHKDANVAVGDWDEADLKRLREIADDVHDTFHEE
jgi:hypothetical protein